MRSKLVRDITLDGLFIAILIIMTFVPNIGFITIGPISIVLIHVPVIIGAILLGWKRGLLYGAAFGIASLIKASTMPAGTFDAFFINPLISVLPRLIFGLVAGLLAKVLLNPKKSAIYNRLMTIPVAVISTIVHTAGVAAFLMIFHNELANWPFVILLLTNLGLEVAVAAILTPIFYLALAKLFASRHNKYKINNDEGVAVMKNINFKELVKGYESATLETLKEFVNINSVYDPSSVSDLNPYGAGVSRALAFIENLAKSDGFEVKNIENRVVEITIGDANLPNIGIFAHADVVPATGDWVSPPFAAEEREGKLYGRGTSDDKGPAIASYYALKALYDNDLIKGYSVRLVIGGDEERGSSCMHFYFNTYKAAAPLYGFTPDAEFPLIYGEKGIINFKMSKTIDLSPIISFKGGEASNSVIDKVSVILPNDEKLLEYLTENNVKFSVNHDKKTMNVTFIGKSAHGSLPELGINAGVILFKRLGEYFKNEHLQNLATKLSDPSGKSMNAFLETPLLHASTYNMGLLNYEDGELSFVINFRHPENVDLAANFTTVAEELNMKLEKVSQSKPLLFDPESLFIKTLLSAYQDETGDLVSKPLAIGGGTYAKECPNTVAFGSAFSGRPGDIHSPNEQVLISDLYAQSAIYARAVYYLGTKLCG